MDLSLWRHSRAVLGEAQCVSPRVPEPSAQAETGTRAPPLCQALLGDQYGPCPVPTLIEEKEWEALRAQLTSKPRDLELVARRFRRDENAVPPAYLLQSLGTSETPGPEEATLTSVLHSGAQEARRLGLITQEQWRHYHWSGEAARTPPRGPQETPHVHALRTVPTPQPAPL